ncbi:hypothetical protein JCM10213_005441 [Rhodosporidiobolus nylandii]
MARSQSISFSSASPSPFAPIAPVPSTSSQAPPSPSKGLSKASSFADLRLAKRKLFKRLRGGSRELDFECGGHAEEEEDDALEGDQTLQGRPPIHRPQIPSAPPSCAALPPRPAPYRFPLAGPPSEDELRRLARQQEEELAADACLAYMSTQSHARKNSRSSSLAHLDTSSLGPAIERLSLRRGSVQEESTSDAFDERRRRSSHASSSISSRPRTNDSLPSFAESASTIDSTGSFPPSPVQSPTLKSRPTFAGSFAPVKVDTEAVAGQSRAYAFI